MYFRDKSNYGDLSAGSSLALDDALKQYLVSQGYTGSVQDMLYSFLGSLGYVGSLPDRLAQWDGTFSSAFNPATLPLLGWWDVTDGDTVTVVGSNCSQINDKSGNSNHLTQTTDVLRVPYEASNAITGGPSLVWPLGGATRMNFTTALSSVEMYFVGAYGDGTTATFNNFNSLLEGNSGAGLAEKIHGDSADNFWRTSAESPANITYYKNGSSLTSNIVLPAPFAVYHADYDAPSVGREFTKFGGESTNRSWYGPIAELLVCETKLTSEEQTDLLTYLYSKHGITP